MELMGDMSGLLQTSVTVRYVRVLGSESWSELPPARRGRRLNGGEAEAIYTLTTNCVAGMDHQSSLRPPTGRHRSPSLSPLPALFERRGDVLGMHKLEGGTQTLGKKIIKINGSPCAGLSAGGRRGAHCVTLNTCREGGYQANCRGGR